MFGDSGQNKQNRKHHFPALGQRNILSLCPQVNHLSVLGARKIRRKWWAFSGRKLRLCLPKFVVWILNWSIHLFRCIFHCHFVDVRGKMFHSLTNPKFYQVGKRKINYYTAKWLVKVPLNLCFTSRNTGLNEFAPLFFISVKWVLDISYNFVASIKSDRLQSQSAFRPKVIFSLTKSIWIENAMILL